MDEIIRQNTAGRKASLPRVRGSLGPVGDLALDTGARLGRAAGKVFHKVDSAVAGRRLAPVIFLVLALMASAWFVVSSIYTRSFVVTVDGKEVGTVLRQSDYTGAAERVEARASAILGHDYKLKNAVAFQPTLTEKTKISPVSGFETYLFNQVGEVMKTYVLTVNGTFIGASDREDAITAMLDGLKAPYLTKDTISSELVGDIDITYQYTASDVQQDSGKMRAALSANTREKVTYTVVGGDTYSDIAYNNDMSLDELMALNPQASLDSLLIGDELTVTASIPFLSVKTVEAVTYTEELPCPVEEREDSSRYVGNDEVLQEGVPGEALVSAKVTYLNGTEQSRDVTQTVTTRAATTRIVAVGTKVRPKTMAKGYFIWPCYGTITSYFGYRSIFGTYSYHGGLDIAVPYGTTISAADGGTVVWSGYKGSYGNLIIIDHGNGKRTYYGHNSRLYVQSGTKVYQGQAIAAAGSTGRSTGNHCHFEVKLNGTSVNPLSYLP